MKTDFYTKTVLTVIAICLTINVVKDIELFPKAFANESNKNLLNTNSNEHLLTNDNNTIDVRIVDINTYDELNVNLKSVDTYDELDVTIKNIETSDALDVNIDEVGGRSIFSGEAIPVKIN